MNEPCIDLKIIRQIEENEPEIRQIQIAAACREAFKTLDSATGLTRSDPPWLWTLKIKGKEARNDKTIQEAVIKAMQAADSNPDLWSKTVKAVNSPLNDTHILQSKKVQWRLLEFWLAKSGAPFQFSFCYYNDKALAKLVDFQFDFTDGHYDERSIRQIWKRLGLTKSRRLLFRDIKIENGVAFPVSYGKVIQRSV